MCKTLISCLSHTPNGEPGLQPRHVPLTETRTSDLLVCGTMPNLLSHTSRGTLNVVFEKSDANQILSLAFKLFHDLMEPLRIGFSFNL